MKSLFDSIKAAMMRDLPRGRRQHPELRGIDVRATACILACGQEVVAKGENNSNSLAHRKIWRVNGDYLYDFAL